DELNRTLSKSSSSLVNRRMRTRMSGGVRGRGLAAPSYSMLKWVGAGALSLTCPAPVAYNGGVKLLEHARVVFRWFYPVDAKEGGFSRIAIISLAM
ncbi:hypothetical protein SAMN02745219_02032, partial [Desulfofundulus thermosubterraneus DSM 16057]